MSQLRPMSLIFCADAIPLLINATKTVIYTEPFEQIGRSQFIVYKYLCKESKSSCSLFLLHYCNFDLRGYVYGGQTAIKALFFAGCSLFKQRSESEQTDHKVWIRPRTRKHLFPLLLPLAQQRKEGTHFHSFFQVTSKVRPTFRVSN